MGAGDADDVGKEGRGDIEEPPIGGEAGMLGRLAAGAIGAAVRATAGAAGFAAAAEVAGFGAAGVALGAEAGAGAGAGFLAGALRLAAGFFAGLRAAAFFAVFLVDFFAALPFTALRTDLPARFLAAVLTLLFLRAGAARLVFLPVDFFAFLRLFAMIVLPIVADVLSYHIGGKNEHE